MDRAERRKEYGCELTHSDCNEYECPLVCRYKVEEQEKQKNE